MAIADARRQANVSTDVLKLMLPCPDAKASGNAFAQVLNSGFAADQLKMISQVFIIAGPSWKDLKDIALTHADDSSKELFLRSTFVTLVGHAFLQTDLQGLSHAQLSFLAKHARVVVTETDLISLLQHPLDDSQMYLLGNTLQPVTLKTEAGVLALAQSSNRTLLNGRVLITDERLLATALKAGFGASELKSFVGAEQLHPGPLVAAFEKQKVPDAVIVDFLLANRNKVYLEPLDIAALSESTLLGSQIGRLVMDSSHAALQISPGIVARLKLKGVEDEAILGLTFARHEGMPSPPDIMRTNYGDPMARLDPLNGHAESSKSNDNGSPRNEDGYGPASGGGRGAGVYRIGGDVSAPILISKIEPEYSDDARKACYSGTALLSIVVDANGLPRDIHLIRSVGLGLDQKAIEAVLKCCWTAGCSNIRTRTFDLNASNTLWPP